MRISSNFPRVMALVLLLILAIMPANSSQSQSPFNLADCREAAFSTEEDFLTQAGAPADGNPIISDGDLLSRNGTICARNRQLVHALDVTQDLGLDAVDVIDIREELIAFSTELDSPHGNFTAGDLLTNKGAAIPNSALMAAFGQHPDLGLDALHFVGETRPIEAFLAYALDKGRGFWAQNPNSLPAMLKEYSIDIWFSIEGTAHIVGALPILDGDLLSAANGAIVKRNGEWLAAPIPAGLPSRGVDFGLDAFGADCFGNMEWARFSTEILYRNEAGNTLTDGDVLAHGGGVLQTNWEWIAGFEPMTRMLGLDALSYPYWRESCGQETPGYLPLIVRHPRSVW
jgi:hypothetical protein